MRDIDMILKTGSFWNIWHFIGCIIMVGLILNSEKLLADAYPNNYYQRKISIPSKSEVRRGINIDLQVATEAPSSKLKLQEVLEDMMQAAKEGLEDSDSATLCPTCSDLLKEKPIRKLIQELRPGYPCDHWDPKQRTCIFERNIGDSVTFVLDLPQNLDNSVRIVWKQEFQILNTASRKNFTIDSGAPPWNIVIGSRGSELRLSPITELDIDFNYFSATIDDGETDESNSKRKVIFKIRVMPIDQGTLYPGAFLMLNMLSFVSLPEDSLTFKWYMEDENELKSLPSNMRVSPYGGLLTISELRREQRGIMSCSVYTNLNVFATKKRFLIREVNQENNRLMFLPTRPIKYHTEISKRLYRHKRQFESSFNDDVTPKYDDNATPIYNAPDKSEYVNSNKKSSSDSEFIETQKNDDNAVRSPFNSDKDESIGSRRKTNPKSEFTDGRKYDDSLSRSHFAPNRDEYNESKRKPNLMSESVEARKYDDNAVRINFIPKQNEFVDSNKNSINKFGSVDEDSIDDVTDNTQLSVQADEDSTHLTTSDKIAMLISKCDAESECALSAKCIKRKKTEPGFCRCLERFEGNGIFCWEVHKPVPYRTP